MWTIFKVFICYNIAYAFALFCFFFFLAVGYVGS